VLHQELATQKGLVAAAWAPLLLLLPCFVSSVELGSARKSVQKAAVVVHAPDGGDADRTEEGEAVQGRGVMAAWGLGETDDDGVEVVSKGAAGWQGLYQRKHQCAQQQQQQHP
jgi:hypothetical protein